VVVASWGKTFVSFRATGFVLRVAKFCLRRWNVCAGAPAALLFQRNDESTSLDSRMIICKDRHCAFDLHYIGKR